MKGAPDAAVPVGLELELVPERFGLRLGARREIDESDPGVLPRQRPHSVYENAVPIAQAWQLAARGSMLYIGACYI